MGQKGLKLAFELKLVLTLFPSPLHYIEHPFLCWTTGDQGERRVQKNCSRSGPRLKGLAVVLGDASQNLQAGRGRGDQALGQSVPWSPAAGAAVRRQC